MFTLALTACSLSRTAAAQEFKDVTDIQILKQAAYDNSTAEKDLESLKQKLPVLQNSSSSALFQLKLLSPRSRAKLDKLDGAPLSVRSQCIAA